MRKAAKRFITGLAFMMAGASCSVIVGDTVPDFGCTIDAPGVCPANLHCDTTMQKCVATDASTPIDEPADDDAGDANTSHPDTSMEADAPSGPLDLGSACHLDGDCASKLCASSTVLTTAIAPPATGPICTTPCCSSTDCPSSFVCFNGGTGGSYCVPARLAGRTLGTTSGGGKMAGLTCTTNADCRSGLCGLPSSDTGTSVCMDTCCGNTECGGTSVCRIGGVDTPAPAHNVWVCAPPEPGAFEPAGYSGVDCSTVCTTNACSAGTNCRPSCSSTASCMATTGFETGICIHGQIGTEFVRFCQKTPISGGLPIGSTCTTNTDCADDYCDNELKICANVCGLDSDCAPTEACRPSASGTPFLRCVPKPQ